MEFSRSFIGWMHEVWVGHAQSGPKEGGDVAEGVGKEGPGKGGTGTGTRGDWIFPPTRPSFSRRVALYLGFQ